MTTPDTEARLAEAITPAPQPEGEPVTLTYTNWRGETAQRTITPKRIWWGATDWHPEPQWLLTAFDAEKQADRDFALKDFGAATPQAAQEAVPVAWGESYDGGAFFHTVSLTKTKHHTYPLYAHPPQPSVSVAGAAKLADAIEACDWSGSPIGNKMILRAAVKALRALKEDR